MFARKSLVLYFLCITPTITTVVRSRVDSTSYLSNRGDPLAAEIAAGKSKNAVKYSPMYTKQNPNGFVNLGTADNFLMHEDIKAHIESNFSIDVTQDMTYNTAIGDPRLRNALANYINDDFHPFEKVLPEEFAIGAGLGSMFDQIAWSVCDGPQDGILIPRPLYNSFPGDFSKRSNATVVGASFSYEGQHYDMNSAFDAGANYKALERAYNNATKNGISIKAVFIVNPHNPLGRCYTKAVLKEFVRFCSERKVHLFSDEIYARSVYTNNKYPNAPPFTSVLALDLKKLIDAQLVHVLYGMSKDFSASGFRLGAIWSRNQALINSITSLNSFTKPAFINQAMWAGVLEDREYLKAYWKRYSQRLTVSFNTMRDWLDARQITYFKGTNAGLFLWARLVNWPESRNEGEYTAWKTKFLALCLETKLSVADGDTYWPENADKGWFRLTHSVGADRQKAGLDRLSQILAQMSKETV